MAASNERKKLLEVSGLTMDFGGLRAIDNVGLDIFEGEIVALIGPNGAGKTTFFNCVTGIYEPTQGDVKIHPPGGATRRINGMKPNRITALGMARTFQNIRLFPAMTVLENVMIGRHCRTHTGIVRAILGGAATAREEKESVDKSYQLLKKVGLAEVADEFSRNLSYGAQRRLEIARALATDPFLLLLDEPAAGMNPQETHELDALITRIRDEEKVAILLIEHDMKLVMNISDRIYVMEYGKEIAQGTPQQIKENPKVIEAYLGEEAHA
ncbi:ABC transporter ATP-binding protein [Propionivibrio sp.]|jgi:branched-chain amino acid transport system ATP-binding protein|uniref:ABC transporter ATP-binding protein n=1 Tax=Propionivibrio sp. TaxID=2212460 RepID=UPI00272E7B8D|nr:ABC transporter ATP-binding protein [Propionivibrio sp.]